MEEYYGTHLISASGTVWRLSYYRHSKCKITFYPIML